MLIEIAEAVDVVVVAAGVDVYPEFGTHCCASLYNVRLFGGKGGGYNLL